MERIPEYLSVYNDSMRWTNIQRVERKDREK